ncbi:glycosyltransferase [bacterium]|nr:glycosyltransferase [bacterium]
MEASQYLEKNLILLKEKEPVLFQKIEKLNKATPLAIIKPAKNLQITGQYPDEKEALIWIHSPINPSREAEKTFSRIEFETCQKIILLGLGFGYVLFELMKRVKPFQEIVVIEKEVELFYHSLYLFDYKDLLTSTKVRLLAGLEIEESFNLIGSIGNTKVISTEGCQRAFPDYYLKLEKMILESAYHQITTLKKRLKIISFMDFRLSGTRYILEDSLAALSELDQEVYVIDLNKFVLDREKNLLNEKNIALIAEKAIEEIKPNFIFTVTCVGLKFILEVIKRFKIPYVSWFADAPVSISTIFKPDPLFFIFMWDKTYIKELNDMGYEHVYYLPLATNPKIFKRMELSKEDKERYAGGISFAGMLADPYATKMYKKHRALFNEMFSKKVVDKLIKTLSQDPTLSILDLLIDIQEQEGVIKDISLEYKEYLKERVSNHLEIIDCISMRKYRKNTIRAIADLGVKVYGDKGWLEVKQEGVKYGGYIHNRSELPRLYNASEINLNITVSQLRTAINMRVFDIGGCGGFMLSDYREDLVNLFSKDTEVIFYKNNNELREKIIYFLYHPEERRKIAEAFHKKVLEEHTYLHRLKKMLSILKDKIT